MFKLTYLILKGALTRTEVTACNPLQCSPGIILDIKLTMTMFGRRLWKNVGVGLRSYLRSHFIAFCQRRAATSHCCCLTPQCSAMQSAIESTRCKGESKCQISGGNCTLMIVAVPWGCYLVMQAVHSRRTLHCQSTLGMCSRRSWSGRGLTKGPTAGEMARSLERSGWNLTSGWVWIFPSHWHILDYIC